MKYIGFLEVHKQISGNSHFILKNIFYLKFLCHNGRIIQKGANIINITVSEL
jgi:hypothetical protein